ncbi:MAG: hypothetical protein WAL75_21865, partial [Terracidiphilus sp.]
MMKPGEICREIARIEHSRNKLYSRKRPAYEFDDFIPCHLRSSNNKKTNLRRRSLPLRRRILHTQVATTALFLFAVVVVYKSIAICEAVAVCWPLQHLG